MSHDLRFGFAPRLHPLARLRRAALGLALGAGLVAALALALPAQTGTQGGVTVLVTDPSGGVVAGAALTLKDLATGSTRTGATQSVGTYSFLGLPAGTYSLTIVKQGFQKQVFGSVLVQAAQVTDLRAALKVGAVSSEVVVSASAVPIVQTTTNAIGTTIDLKQVHDLPLSGRDIAQLAQVVPGYNGTWDGLPTAAQGNNINGVVSSSSRMKFAGNADPALSARLEDMQEMTVSTDQLGLAQGNGQSNMQVSFTSKRGSNAFHGLAYEDFRNSALNANRWFNNAAGVARDHLILNDFGAAIGGPILHNKLFFFGSFATARRPGSQTTNNGILTAAAQAGIFSFIDKNGPETVNVLKDIAAPNGLPATVNPTVAGELQKINNALKLGAVSPSSNGDPNTQELSWQYASPTIDYYPSLRLDYDATQNLRFDFNYLESTSSSPNTSAPPFPGPDFANRSASNRSTNYTTGLGVDWTLSPTMINQFRGGFLYDATWYAYDSAPLYNTEPIINWAVSNPSCCQAWQAMSGQWFPTPITTYYPVVNFTNTLSWQHGAHLFNFGASFYREQDHYWNAPLGYPNFDLYLGSQDPALADFENSPRFANVNAADRTTVADEAGALYASLVGRIGDVNGQHAYDAKNKQYLSGVGAYPLDELQQAWGLFFEDSYHLTSNLTLNYGLRWDFTGDDHDLTNAYTSANLVNIYGPTAPGDIFKPGVLKGVANPMLTTHQHQYNPWHKSPQPAFGFAWNPSVQSGWLGGLLGGQSTVIRGGYALRYYTEPNQFFWNEATDGGFNYYQSFNLNQASGGAPGTFAPGSLALGDTVPAYGFTPATFSSAIPMSELTFSNSPYGAAGMNPNIHQPYVESWTFGIQRELGRSNVLEVRYVANHTVHQWVSLNPNEVNIFENGFLNEFKAAQNNLAINAANGKPNSFADNGFAGQQNLPIMTAAGVSPTGSFVSLLKTGQAGEAAGQLANNPNYLCNLVGSVNFSPCVPYVGAGVAGAYPLNFLQANPFGAGTQGPPYLGNGTAGYMTDAGSGNYNSLQVDLRQKQWHGMQFDVNYTWSHTLGIQPDNSWTGSFNLYTMRDLRNSYGPALYDHNHTIHAYGTYDLPFGLGRTWLNNGGLLDKVVGDWTVGTFLTYQTGAPFRLTGGYRTFNDYGTGGIDLSGVTTSELQSAVGIQPVPGKTYATGIDPKYIASGGRANSSFLTPNITPGSFGFIPWLHGPSQFFQDLSLTKSVPVTERLHMELQGEFLNVWNHPVWGSPNGSIRSSGFGHAGILGNTLPREIQLRANLTF